MRRPNWKLYQLLLARAMAPAEGDDVPDAELLHRFRAMKDAAAFELLVRRHCDLVYGTCRRICRDEHDAEDAFQATFLILARKAGTVRQSLALSGWLHRVARRAASEASTRRARISLRESSMTADVSDRSQTSCNELPALIDGEIDRLPERLRLPVLLCCLEELTATDAATRLGIPLGTVLSRLARAREILAERLTRRGVDVPLTVAGIAAAIASPNASATLIASTNAVVLTPVAGSAVELLSLEVLRMTAWKPTSAWAAALVLTAGLGTGTTIILAQGTKPAPPAATAPAAESPAKQPAEVKNDQNGPKMLKWKMLTWTPAKEEATDSEMRKLLKARYAEILAAIVMQNEVIISGNADSLTLMTAPESAIHLAEARAAIFDQPAERIATYADLVEYMLYLESIMQTKHEVGSLKMQDLHLYRYYRIDAEIRLAKAKEPAAK